MGPLDVAQQLIGNRTGGLGHGGYRNGVSPQLHLAAHALVVVELDGEHVHAHAADEAAGLAVYGERAAVLCSAGVAIGITAGGNADGGGAATGSAMKATFYKCSLRADGDFALKGDDWLSISFSVDILKDETRAAGNQFFEICAL